MLGRNPFNDTGGVEIEQKRPVAAVLKLLEVNEGAAVLEIAFVDDRGQPVITLSRFELRQGDSFGLANLDIQLSINPKENFDAW